MWICSARPEGGEQCGQRNFDTDEYCIKCGEPRPSGSRPASGFTLAGTRGSYADQRFPLLPGTNLVGRTEGDIMLGDDQQVSRRHCTLQVPSQDVMLTDLGSTNGTHIGDREVEPEALVPLAPGDLLRIGGSTFRLEGPASVTEARTEPPDDAAGDSGDAAEQALATTQQAGAQVLAGAQSAVQLGREKAQEYAPHIRAAAEKAREHARAGAEQVRLATRTGIRPLFVLLFAVGLLVICMVLPLILSMPMLLVVNTRTDTEEQTADTGLSQYVHNYSGTEHVAVFSPLQMTDEIGLPAVAATVVAGPIVMTGAGLKLAGHGFDENGTRGFASASLSLQSNSMWMWFLLGLVIVLIIADLLLGDQWAMQKLLAGLVLTWLAYAGILGTLAAFALTGVIRGMAEGGVQLFPSFSGVFEAPMRIALLGGAYWLASILWRRLARRRPQLEAAEAEQ